MDTLFQLLDSAADGAFVIDDEQRIIYWNNAAQKILGYSPDDVIGHPCYTVLRGCDEKGQILCHLDCNIALLALEGQPVSSYDVATRTKTGEMRWINVSILSLQTTNGSRQMVVHLFRDATQTKQNEQFIHQMFDTVERWQRVAMPEASRSNIQDLTEREKEVLTLLAQGHSTAKIAKLLSISSATVRNHIQNILHKLDVHSRVEAVAYAFEHGLIHNT